ncbi:1-deoxy-D-xylulose-5-phosphate reductoisomerase [Candidatus Albibeggiatoa sp. nov. NOAA]|uniref:1-deoxy-D-xylulose-5-phosphate reductoisomerase n=1 Tax=Candidatus Albibeggiatoa sp. nov. NOAA TaxID=3162724 RepID=UPI0032FE9CE4|nr:1-deoxy-D-xylulose-5-phosphate reductoisomerase [Thiotrichaceae bacterium]
MTGITILGATGTIGLNTLNVIAQHRHQFKVIALTAHTNVSRLAEQCVKWQPKYAVVSDEAHVDLLHKELKEKGYSADTEILAGVEGLIKVASLPEVHTVMAAIVGSAGLLPTLAAARNGKRLLLANKEALVMSGKLFMQAVQNNYATLLPIDSEHNALFQCMPLNKKNSQAIELDSMGIKQLILTASGGPFRTFTAKQLENVTPEQACKHPNWNMGRKISVDSATMMNKGLEVIEACWLFNTPPDKIKVLLHPQSIIHSMVEYVDGSVLAQLGNPDMRTPIAHALTWPERIQSGVDSLNLAEIAQLHFEDVDMQRFPCLRLAYEAMLAGGTTTAILNAANEVAVQAFLDKQIRFVDIPTVIEQTLTNLTGKDASHLDFILEDDAQAREVAGIEVQRLAIK